MKKLKIAFLILIIILLFPIKTTYLDGGTTTYTAILYKIILWNQINSQNQKELDFILFPDNFR